MPMNLPMKRIVLSVLILVLCASFCGCRYLSPLGDVSINAQGDKPVRVYVCGAVLNEGYVQVDPGSDYYHAIAAAGVTKYTYLPLDCYSVIDAFVTHIIVDYYADGAVRSCVDVNGALITYRMDIDGISSAVVDKIADHIEKNGKITDKSVLAAVLGDDYADNYYKFYVAESDYEENS